MVASLLAEVDPTELDLAAEGVTSIIWAIGYRPDYRWIEASVFDGAGRPMQTRGITAVPGLSFIGLPWMYTWGSGRFHGIDRDAAHVAAAIIDRTRPDTNGSRPVTDGVTLATTP